MAPGFFSNLVCCGFPNIIHPESLSEDKAVKQELHASKDVLAAAHGQLPVTGQSAVQDGGKKITIVHFNDVYNIEPAKREPVGGASRFTTKVKSMKDENPLVVFSGDAFNPSLLSTVTLGAQMPPVLNEIGCHVACIGNHDFDFGTANLIKLVKECNFPWLMANVLDSETKKPYAHAHATHTMMWQGVKVGFAGLVEEEWLETLGAVNLSDLEYVDFVEEGHRLAEKLKAEGCELLVAVTHMRVPNDVRLAEECPEFTLILGGHDHHYETQQIGDVTLVKSGTDFREMTKIDVVIPAGKGSKPKVELTKITIDGSIEEDPKVKDIVDGYMGKMAEKMKEVIGYSAVELDGRFTTVRTKESNLGNFICDIIKNATGADCVIINGGTFRSDVIHPSGPFTLGDMMSILPMMDPSVVLEASGATIIEGLENSVCMYPKLEGRFAQVSGISFLFDPNAPPKSRIMHDSVMINGEPIDKERLYTVATKTYVAEGKDGYDCFKSCKMLVDEEAAVLVPTAVRNHFRVMDVLNHWDPQVRVMKFARKWSEGVIKKRSTQNLATVDLNEAQALVNGEEEGEPSQSNRSESEFILPARSAIAPTSGVAVIENKYTIKPLLDGRIIMVDH